MCVFYKTYAEAYRPIYSYAGRFAEATTRYVEWAYCDGRIYVSTTDRPK